MRSATWLSIRNVAVGLAIFGGAAISARQTVAATVNFVAPTAWARGSAPFSTYQQWDVFASVPNGPPPNTPGQVVGSNVASVDAAPFNPYGTANVVDTSGISFSVGGDIYSFSAPTNINITVPTNTAASTGGWTTLILETRTEGTTIDLSSVQVLHNAQTYSPVASALLFTETVPFPPFGDSTSYTLQFNASGPSMALDNVAVDTIWTSASSPISQPIPAPEPAGIALGALGASILWIAKRSRKSESQSLNS